MSGVATVCIYFIGSEQYNRDIAEEHYLRPNRRNMFLLLGHDCLEDSNAIKKKSYIYVKKGEKMKRGHIRTVSTLFWLILCSFLLTGCDGDGIGPGSSQNDGPPFSEEKATSLTLSVYSKLNEFAMRGPGDYSGGSVRVQDDYGSNIMNAQYWNEVTVTFNEYSYSSTEASFTIDGSGIVKAIMDSYNGKYIIEYDGTFSGEYQGDAYTLSIEFETEQGLTFTSGGTFTVNGNTYTFSVDSADALEQGDIPTS